MKVLRFKSIIIVVIVSCDFISNTQALFHSTKGTTSSNQFANELWKHIQNENDKIAAGMRIKVYTGSSIETANITNIPVAEPELIYQLIDHTKPLVLYVHGFREHPSNESIQTIVQVHLERGTDNIFLLDWSDLAYDNYVTVVSKIKGMSRILADTFNVLIELGLNLETFHLVGHSLGAQIGGFFGKYSRYSIPRITGLDPAKPGFYHVGADHIDAESARFVDIIHTDGGFYGALQNTGTADFFANGGTRSQPGCPFLGVPLTPSDLCNHWRSWRFYAESVRNIYAFPATLCSSYRDYMLGNCRKNSVVYFGYASSQNARGSYFFTTNHYPPYGRGIRGFYENYSSHWLSI